MNMQLKNIFIYVFSFSFTNVIGLSKWRRWEHIISQGPD